MGRQNKYRYKSYYPIKLSLRKLEQGQGEQFKAKV